MSGAGAPPGLPSTPNRGLVGFVDALGDGQVVVGWAADPRDRAARPVIRLMRGLEVLAECVADVDRDDGNPGFRLRAPLALAPEDFLEGRLRVRALLPGRQAATTLAMTRRMREQLEDAAGWEPTTRTPAPAPVAPAPAAPAPAARVPAEPVAPEPPPPAPARSEPVPPEPVPPEPVPPMPAPQPEPLVTPAIPAATWPAPGWTPRPPAPGERPPPLAAPIMATPPPQALREEPQPEPQSEPQPATPPAAAWPEPGPDPDPPLPSPLASLQAMARLAEAARRPVLHLLVPTRASVLGGAPSPELAVLEGLAAARPLLMRDWVPLRHAFARQPQPATLWRLDGRSLSVEGCVALLSTLLAVLHLRHPKAAMPLARAAGLLARSDLATLPRRDLPAEATAPARDAFLGVSVAETEPVLPADLFADLPAPRLTEPALPGLEAWSSASAPLPWRVVVLAEPGLGGSAGPARPGWWLRRMMAECVISEALHLARPAAVLGAQPDLVLTLAAESA